MAIPRVYYFLFLFPPFSSFSLHLCNRLGCRQGLRPLVLRAVSLAVGTRRGTLLRAFVHAGDVRCGCRISYSWPGWSLFGYEHRDCKELLGRWRSLDFMAFALWTRVVARQSESSGGSYPYRSGHDNTIMPLIHLELHIPDKYAGSYKVGLKRRCTK
ncbi:hypothetical protein HDV57DRAFT_327519 [Trichoderma longibrachiatum]